MNSEKLIQDNKADVRIVQTVRRLKSLNKENELNNSEQKLNDIPIEKRIASNSTIDKTIISSNNNININSSLIKGGSD